MIKFQKKLVSRIRELRNEKELAQLELAKLVGVSRQTIYFLERGTSSPSLTLSMKIAEIFGKPIEKIFYFEPVIKDLIGSKKVDELDEIAKAVGVSTDDLMKLRDLTDEELSKKFTEEDLIEISIGLGVNFEDLFLIED